MVYQINDQIFYPRAGQALFGNSNTMHTGRMENGRDCRYISITFHPRLLYGYQGSRIASRYTDPLMEKRRPAGCLLRPVAGMARGSGRASGGYYTH